MSWTAPMTFVANQVLTAAQLNTHLRDNVLETEVAKAVTIGGYFVATGKNRIAERLVLINRVNTTQGTTSTSYTDLETGGPTLTVNTGSRCFVITSCGKESSVANGKAAMSWEISGATTRPADDQVANSISGCGLLGPIRSANFDLLTTLNPGENTFTCKYKSDSTGTATFRHRMIAVIPL